MKVVTSSMRNCSNREYARYFSPTFVAYSELISSPLEDAKNYCY
jgi:hypothetical protein